MTSDFEVEGKVAAAPFSLRVRRGEGMALLSMDWKEGKPPKNFVGFGIECRPPKSDRFSALSNRLSFPNADGSVDRERRPTTEAPLQKFRWVHFPYDAEVDGEFLYRVTPVFMDEDDALSSGEPQTAAIALGGATYPERLNVAFTRGFVSSQAFVDRYQPKGKVSTLVPTDADKGLDFEPSHPEAEEALNWMGFEGRRAVIEVLDQALADQKAEVRVVAYDLNEPEVVSRLERLGKRLKVIVDDSGAHGEPGSAETEAARRLAKSAGADNVKRQDMGGLQHNKTIAVDGPDCKAVVCGSTNLSWRGFFIQSNNAVVLHGEVAVEAFFDAFDNYWEHEDPTGFGATPSAEMIDLGVEGVDARVAFSPHVSDNALLEQIADDIAGTESSLLYSLAFLYQTPGRIREAVTELAKDEDVFIYGISDKRVAKPKKGEEEDDGVELLKPSGERATVFAAALGKDVPEPFKSEPVGGSGVRMHHKFAVVDFDKPSARVYLGSYNFSVAADTKNGENLLLIRDRRIATSYLIEALRTFDHYHFRIAQEEAEKKREVLALAKPPREAGEKPWWDEYYTEPQKLRDRQLFA
jgi:phosphatidylserine/phosphatidylglycerophosphate/cardiolipin synthase-like enzyme